MAGSPGTSVKQAFVPASSTRQIGQIGLGPYSTRAVLGAGPIELNRPGRVYTAIGPSDLSWTELCALDLCMG
jgi:hypothetical protein